MQKNKPQLEPSNKSRNSNFEGIQWDVYADSYDLLPEVFPTYRDNLELLRSAVAAHALPDNPLVVDLGAGTGNYLVDVAKYIPNARLVHVDSSTRMNEVAKAKYEEAGLDVEIVEKSIEDMSFERGSISLVLCVNVIYALPKRELLLQDISQWMDPEGLFFLLDFGRQQSAFDWGVHAIRNTLVGRTKLRTLAKYFSQATEVAKQAAVGAKSQREGLYWMHDREEMLALLRESGFSVHESGVCYRGYCDYAVSRPAPIS